MRHLEGGKVREKRGGRQHKPSTEVGGGREEGEGKKKGREENRGGEKNNNLANPALELMAKEG